MILYTSTLSYRGKDKLNITVAESDPIGKYFAPTWDMVSWYKNGTIDWAEYKQLYFAKMHLSYKEHKEVWDHVLSLKKVTIVCFCKTDRFCHRFLLADIFAFLGAEYKGER